MKVSWLHKIGVDVCRLRREDIEVVYQKPQSSRSTETHSSSQHYKPTTPRTTPGKKRSKDDLFSQSTRTVRKVSISSTKNQTLDRNSNSRPSFQICVYTTSEFAILYDHALSLKNELIQDLAHVLQLRRSNKLTAHHGETSIFQWPPESSSQLTDSSDDDLQSAARALLAFLTENTQQLQVLLIIGETVNSVLVDKVEKDFAVYRVKETSTKGGWKRALWTELKR